jgi:hypothetical protein
MPLCSEAALEAALRELSEHAASSRARSNWMSTFLVAQRMQAAGYPYTTAGADSGVDDLFVLVPAHPRGRSNPFVDLGSDYRWGQVENSGRKTVWNTGTRNGAQTGLFNQGHFSNGLRPDAIDVMLQHLGTEEPLPGQDALSVLLTRNHDWPSQPSRQELHDAARTILGLSQHDFERITDNVELAVPVLRTPEWSPELLEASELGPPAATAAGGAPAAPVEDIPIESVQDLPEQFRKFLGNYGIATGSHDELVDLLAAALSSQFVIMAGPSGSGKSLMASALAAFFAPKDRRCRLEASRLLAKPEEFLGYYSHFAGEKFMAYDQLLLLLALHSAGDGTPPMITIEEANLSPMEGYLSALVHGLGGLETPILPVRLHTQAEKVDSQVPDQKVPPVVELQPYPRFFTTINVDADSPAPARKVVSRACVVLLETPTFETALAAADTLVHPSVEDAGGPASALIGRPTIAFDRYAGTGSDVYQQALSERAAVLREKLGVDVIAHRQLQHSLMYMAWCVELSGETEAEQDHPAVEAAADNALLHFVLPSLPAAQFEHALEVLSDGRRAGVLATRLGRLRSVVAEQQFGPPPDFWGALS